MSALFFALLIGLLGLLGLSVPGEATTSVYCVVADPTALNPTAICSSCVAGQFYNATLGGCSSCPAGSFSSYNGATICSVCAAGTYQANAGQTSCDSCPDHYVRPAISGETPSSNSMSSCYECPLGYTANEEMTSCDACDAGKFQNSTLAALNTCSSCEGNTIAANAGTANCTVCPDGYYSNNYLACTGAPPGYYIPPNSDPSTTIILPIQCPIGRYSDATAMTACLNCTAGTIAPSEGTSSCMTCANATYADQLTAASTCIDCPGGRYSYAGSTNCTACNTGEVLDSQETYSCSRCPAGRFVNQSDPVLYNTCQTCTNNTISPVGSSNCTFCAQGRVHLDHIRCSACPKGYYAGTGLFAEQCLICPVGYYSAGNLFGSCVAASPGFHVPVEGADSPTACGLGNITSSSGQSRCQTCPTGTAAIGGTVCGQCIAGYASDSTGASCSPCSRGTYAISGSAICTECSPGYVQPNDAQTTCMACSAGYSQEDFGRTSCTICAAGTYSLVGNATCSFCPAGYFNNVTGLTGCTSCAVLGPRYFSRDPAQTTCLLASNGTQALSDRTDEDPCVPGTYQYLNMPYCADCPAGKITGVSSATSCNDCPLGKFTGADGFSTCVDCSAGFFGNTTGLSRCFQCSGNAYSAAGQSACQICGPGYYIEIGTSTSGSSGACAPAPLGYYVALPGQMAPLPCPVGRYTGSTAMTGCTLCERGKYQNNITSSSCEFVPAGYAAGQQGNSNPIACPIGRYTPAPGFSRCQFCQPGYVNVLTAQSECLSCPSGRYSTQPTQAGTNNGNLVCAPCSGNTFAPNTSMSSCVDCPPGTIVEAIGRSSCQSCTAGFFRNGTQCSPCGEGEYTLDVAQWLILKEQEAALALATTGQVMTIPDPPTDLLEKCSRCEPGYYSVDQPVVDPMTLQTVVIKMCSACRGRTVQPKSGMARCGRCEDGTYPDELRTVCLSCTAGKYINPDETVTDPTLQCLSCPLGYFSPDGLLKQCIPCPVGTTQSEFSLRDSCDKCTPGTVKESMGAGSCLPCGQSEVSNGNGTKCIKCDTTSSVFDCSSRTLVIPPTGTWYGMALKDPFQLVEAGGGSTSAAPLYSCLRAAACMNMFNESIEANVTVCAPGHTGVLCAVCEPNYALINWNMCQVCSGAGSQLGKSLGLLLFGMFLALAFARRDTNNNGSKANFIAVAKVCLTYVQSLALLVSSLGAEAALLLGRVAETFSFTTNPINEAFSPLQCLLGWRFAETFYLVMAMPIIVLLWAYAVNFVIYVIRRALPSRFVQNKSTMELWEEWQHKSAQTAAILLTFLYMNVVTYIWRAFDFYKPAINGQEYLQSDFRITKDSPAYQTMRAVAWFAIAVYIVAVPLALFLYLWHNQFKLETKWLKSAFKIIYDGYRYVGSRKWEERIAAMQLMAEQEEANRALQKAQMNAKRRAAALPLSMVPGLRSTFPALAFYGGVAGAASPSPATPGGKATPGVADGATATAKQRASLFTFAKGSSIKSPVAPTKGGGVPAANANANVNDPSALVSQKELAAAFLASGRPKGAPPPPPPRLPAGSASASASSAAPASSAPGSAITLSITAGGPAPAAPPGIVQGAPPPPLPSTSTALALAGPPTAAPAAAAGAGGGATSSYQYHYELFGLSDWAYNYILQEYVGGMSYEFGKVRDANRRPVPPTVVGALIRALKKKHGYKVFLEAMEKDLEHKALTETDSGGAGGGKPLAGGGDAGSKAAKAKAKKAAAAAKAKADNKKVVATEALAAQTIATAALSYGFADEDEDQDNGDGDEMEDIRAAAQALQLTNAEFGTGGLVAAASTLAARHQRRAERRRKAAAAAGEAVDLDDNSFAGAFSHLKNEEAMQRRAPDNLGIATVPGPASADGGKASVKRMVAPPVTPSSKYLPDGRINPDGPLGRTTPQLPPRGLPSGGIAGTAQGAGKLRQLVVVRNHLPGYENSAVVKTYRDEKLIAASRSGSGAAAASNGAGASRNAAARTQLVPEARYQFGDEAGWRIVGTYYWEILQIMRKVVVAFLAISYARDAVMQALLGFLLFLLLSIVHTTIAPYDEREVNLLEGMTLIALALTQLLSLVARVDDEVMANVWASGVSIAIFSLNGFVLVCLIGYVAVDAFRSFIVPKVKAWQEARAANKVVNKLTGSKGIGKSVRNSTAAPTAAAASTAATGKAGAAAPAPAAAKPTPTPGSPGGVALKINLPNGGAPGASAASVTAAAADQTTTITAMPLSPLKSALKPAGRGSLAFPPPPIARGASFSPPASPSSSFHTTEKKKTVRIDTTGAESPSSSSAAASASSIIARPGVTTLPSNAAATSLRLPSRAPPSLHPALAASSHAGKASSALSAISEASKEGSPGGPDSPAVAPPALSSPKLSSVAIPVGAASSASSSTTPAQPAGAAGAAKGRFNLNLNVNTTALMKAFTIKTDAPAAAAANDDATGKKGGNATTKKKKSRRGEDASQAELLSLAFPNFLDVYDWRGLAVTPAQVNEALRMIRGINGGEPFVPGALVADANAALPAALENGERKSAMKRRSFFADPEPAAGTPMAVAKAAGFVAPGSGLAAPLVLTDQKSKKRKAGASRSTSPEAASGAVGAGATGAAGAAASAADPATGPMVLMLVEELKAWRRAVRKAEKDAAKAMEVSAGAGSASALSLVVPPPMPAVPKPRLRITRATFRAISEAQAAAGAAKSRERRKQRRVEKKQRKLDEADDDDDDDDLVSKKKKERIDSSDEEDSDSEDDSSFDSEDDFDDDASDISSQESIYRVDEDEEAAAAEHKAAPLVSAGLASSAGSGSTSPRSRSLSPSSSVTLVKPSSSRGRGGAANNSKSKNAEQLPTAADGGAAHRGVAPSRGGKAADSEGDDDDDEDGDSMPSTGSLSSAAISSPRPGTVAVASAATAAAGGFRPTQSTSLRTTASVGIGPSFMPPMPPMAAAAAAAAAAPKATMAAPKPKPTTTQLQLQPAAASAKAPTVTGMASSGESETEEDSEEEEEDGDTSADGDGTTGDEAGSTTDDAEGEDEDDENDKDDDEEEPQEPSATFQAAL